MKSSDVESDGNVTAEVGPAPDGDPIEPRVSSVVAWGSLRAFWACALLLLVVLFGLLAWFNNGSVAIPDDAVYAKQAQLLSDGSWSGPRPAANFDHDGRNSAIGPMVVFGDRQIPYTRHPLFPLLLARFYKVGGVTGLLVFSVIGAWVAAVTAGLMARRLHPPLGIVALALVGLGSPLVFDSLLVSAHAMTAGLCGLTALGVAQAVDSRRWWSLAYAVPAMILAICLRSEAIIVMLALGLVVSAMAILGSARKRSFDLPKLATGASLIGVAAVTYLVEARWEQRIVAAAGGAARSGLGRSLIPDRDPLTAARIDLLMPWYGDATHARPTMFIAAASIVIAAIVLRLLPTRWLLPVGLLLMAATASVMHLFTDLILVTGLLAAMPLLIAGLVLLRRKDFSNPLITRNLLASGITATLIALTSYGEGGEMQWGGRFYHVLLPLLIPAVVVGLGRGYCVLPKAPARIAATALVVCLAVTSTFALRTLDGYRSINKATTETTVRYLSGLGSNGGETSGPTLAIVGRIRGDGSSRMFWAAPSGTEIVSARSLSDIFSLIRRASTAGYSSAVLVTDIPVDKIGLLSDRLLEPIRWGIQDVQSINGSPFGIVQFGPVDAAK